jgi:hypothetical protein
MPQVFAVTATTLNVRRAPAINPANVIGQLGQGELIEMIGQPSTDWLQIQTSRLSGFAAARYLSPVAVPMPVPAAPSPAGAFIPPRVHFPPGVRSAIDSTEARHTPLAGFHPGPRPAGQSDADRCRQLNANIRSLDVERSARYLPTSKSTYCNIYAYDLCFLGGAYMPRVWWMAKALLDLSQGGNPGVAYGKTVRELNANALFDWFSEWGDEYGWQRCVDVTELQDKANHGFVGVICAQRRNLSRSGHITVVAPESAEHAAERTGQTVTAPLQSQAGAKNKPYFTRQWWTDASLGFRAYGFWACP